MSAQRSHPSLLVLILCLGLCCGTSTGTGTDGGQCPVCGSANPNGNVIDLSEPSDPGPFHDLTTTELRNLRAFLEEDKNIRAAKPGNATINSSYIYMADLFVSAKSEVLRYLNAGGVQPKRQARVLMFRGDLKPPTVEEYICGPLPEVTECNLMNFTNRRNPVEFSLRPFSQMEFQAIYKYLGPKVDSELRTLLKESYDATFTECSRPEDCFGFTPSPVGTGLTHNLKERLIWILATYAVPFHENNPVDFGILCNTADSDPNKWSIKKVMYGGQIFDSLGELKKLYAQNSIHKVRRTKPVEDEKLFSTLHQRGEPLPKIPQRPPQQVEPDGKRYSLKDRKVQYMGWEFNFRMSSLTGPTLYDVKFKDERIAYEISLSEIAVFYSGRGPPSQTTNYVDSAALLGLTSRSMVPGGDCPEFATLVNQTFISQSEDAPTVIHSAFCLFELNNGYPVRRHLSYTRHEGSFYGGMLDSVLTLRSILTIGNYDYVIDYVFHQNGVIETRLMSTGYIQVTPFKDSLRDYGFRLHEWLTGTVHHHMVNFKVDLDIAGTSNRFQHIDIVQDHTTLTQDPCTRYHQTKIIPRVIRTEREAVFDYNFNTPKYLLVYNEANKTQYGVKRSYRIQMNGMSPQMIPKGLGNEPSIAWARHQMVVTKHKDEEMTSSSNYGMFDGFNPVVDFSQFYLDNDNIVDDDLVFWITGGMHHIPHTEDFPVTPTVGNHLTFYLLPYNYFPECPSMGSRDAMYIKFKNSSDPSQGIQLERNGNSRDQCLTPRPTLEEDIEINPEVVLEV